MTDKPLLIFDGDCGFCRRWISRWKKITGNKIEYEPYQKVSFRFSTIPLSEFETSIKLVEGERVTSGAEAVFRSLAYNPQKKWMLWFYENIPGFKLVTEAFYSLVAHNRVFFSKLTYLLWGDDVEPSTYFVSRKIFLRALAAVYFIAFISLGIQIKGLIGENGILPAREFLQFASGRLFSVNRFWVVPTLVWLNQSNAFLQFLCWGGALMALLVFAGRFLRPLFFLLWLFYLSLTVAGQDFLSFQWDNLLLEAGFLAIFFAPPRKGLKTQWASEPLPLTFFLYQFLLFKLMFSSGVVKLASGDPNWRNLTALHYHYETQPLPSTASWYFHQLPMAFHKFSAFMMFVIELALPFLVFTPRRLRILGIGGIVSLQLFIMLTGNYGFFNLLSLVLCVLLLEDRFWPAKWLENINREEFSNPDSDWAKILAKPFVFLILIVTLGQAGRLLKIPSPLLAPARALEISVAPFRSINHYGLFAVMTTKRLEILIDGSLDGKVWRRYRFKYKPVVPNISPSFASPHMPRLDWQMWFAALGGYRDNSWFINFCYRLLEGSKDVEALLQTHPFPNAPPKYIRAVLYEYTFTRPAIKKTSGAWWTRQRLGLYCPVLSLSDRTASLPDAAAAQSPAKAQS